MEPTVIELQPDLDLTTEEAERILAAWLRTPATCTGIRRLEGGMVNTVVELAFDQPPYRAVVKLHGREGDPFAGEASALDYLRRETACPVPKVYLYDNTGSLVPHAALLLEHIPGACLKGLDLDPADRLDVERQLADVLVELHTHHGDGWGDVSAPIRNRPWADVFAERLVEVRGHAAVAERLGADVMGLVDTAISKSVEALSDSGIPTLIHSDIWDGNLMVRNEESRWLLVGVLDPSLQFADVEVELAYLEAFDNDRESFFDAYTRHHELRPGYERRRLFYWLHTALVHVALFGDEFFCDYTARIAGEIGRLDR